MAKERIIKAFFNDEPTTFGNFEDEEEALKLSRNLKLKGWKNVKMGFK
jgi:hypothetical protein